MREIADPPSYEELLYSFKVVLQHELRKGDLPPTCLNFGLSLIQALGDVARNVRDGSPTRELAAEAFQDVRELRSRTRCDAHRHVQELHLTDVGREALRDADAVVADVHHPTLSARRSR
jgi:hypothetical protein